MKVTLLHSARVLAVLAVLIAATVSSVAQLPRQISYQGYLAQAGGTPITDGQYTIVLRLYDSNTGGNLLWEETQQINVARGLFNVYLGAVQTLDNVDFSKPMFLETALAGQPAFARTSLAQVPYAIYAGRAGTATSLDSGATGFVRSLNGGEGHLVIKGQDGVVVNRNGDTIVIQSTISVAAIQSITSPEGTIGIVGESGPNTTVDVKDGAISTNKLADNSVTSSKIADNTITTVDISNGAITAAKIAPGVIPTVFPPSGPAGGDLTGLYPNPLLANGSVTTAKIADAAITTPKLTDGAVTTPKLSDGAVTSPKLSSTGVNAGTYGDVMNIPRITVDPQGRVTSITNTSIANFPYIVSAGGDLIGTYPDPIIRNNAITTAKIFDASVTTSKLADFSVTNVKVADGAINSAKIQDFTIVNQDIAPGVIPSVLPPIGPAGGDLIGSTYPNPVIAPGVVTPSKIQPMLGGRFVIGTGTGTSAAVGTIVAGTGMTVTYNNPNIVVATSTVISPGTANDQTLRWDAPTSTWVPNANVTASSAGNVQVGGTLGVTGALTVNGNETINGNSTIGASSSNSVVVNAGSVRMPNIPVGTGERFVMSNPATGAFETRTINNVATGTGTTGRQTRWGAALGSVVDGSLDDDANGNLSRAGQISINSTSNDVVIENAFRVSGRVVSIGDAFGSQLRMREPGGNFDAVIAPDNLGNANRSYVIPNSGVTTTQFVIRDFGGTQSITNGFSIGGTLGVTGATTLAGLTAGASTLNSATVINNTSVGGALAVTGNASVNGNTTLGDQTTDAVTINAASVTAPNLPVGTGERFVISNPATGALETRTVTNVLNTNGFTTTGRIPRFTGPNTLGNGSLDDDGSGTLSRSGNIGINPGIGNTIVTNGSINASGNGSFNGTMTVLGTSLFVGPVTANTNLAVNDNTTLGSSSIDQVTINAATVTAPNLPVNSSGSNYLVSNGGAIQTRNDVVTAFVGGGTSSRTTRWVNATTIGNGSFDDNGAGTISYPGSISINPGAGNSIITNGGVIANGSGSFGGSLSTSSTLGVTSTATFFGNTVLGDAAADAVTVNAASVTAPNLPTGSASNDFIVRNGNALQVRTINNLPSGNIPTGTGTNGRMTRWGAGNTLVDASLDDNGNGQFTRDGSIRLASNLSSVNIDDGLVVSGRDVFIGDAFGGSLSIREPGGNFSGRITVDNLGNATRNYIIPNSSVATTRFLVGDFNGIQNINSSVQIGGPLTLLAGTADYSATMVDPANTTNTYLAFGEAGSSSDYAYLRQIGGVNTYHLALDFHDDGNDARFSIRSIGSALSSPDPAPVTRLALDQEGRFMINASSSAVPFYFVASGSMDGIETPASTDAASLLVTNTNNASGTAHAVAAIRSGGASGGDAYLSLDVANESGWSIGVDNSDNNRLKIMDTWEFGGNALMTFDRALSSTEIGSTTVRMPNIASGSTSNTFVVSNGGSLQTRTISNIATGTGTSGRMTRWGAGNTLVDASLDDNGGGVLTRGGNIEITSTTGVVNIDGSVQFDGGTVSIGGGLGGKLRIKDTWSAFSLSIMGEQRSADQDYVIPTSSAASTRFLIRDFNGTQNVNSTLAVNGRFSATTSASSANVPFYFASNGTFDVGEEPDNNDAATLYLYNTNAAASNANAIALIRTNGVNSGNPYLAWDITNDLGYSMGIDNVDNKLKIFDQWRFQGNTMMTFDRALNATEINTGTVRIPNIASGSSSNSFVVSNGGSLQTRTINNITTGTGTTNRLARWTSANTQGDGSIIDDGAGNVTVNGTLSLIAQTSTVNSSIVDAANRTNTYLYFDHAGSNNDWAYLRQIGGNDNIHLSLDFHDNGNGSFSIRTIESFPATPDPAPVTRFTVQSDKVGINTATPDYPLHVNNPATAGTVLGNDKVLRLERAGSGFDFFVTDDFNLANYGSGGANYAANVAGKQLVVNFGGEGQIIFGDNVGPWSDANYDLGTNYARWRNLYYSGGLFQFSDHRLKTDLRSFDALSIINQLPVYDFQWKSSGIRNFGFMAHELQAAVPYLVEGAKDAVNDMGEPVYQSVDYSKLTPILTKAIQEQQAVIEKQQSTINDQQERLEKLEELVKELLKK